MVQGVTTAVSVVSSPDAACAIQLDGQLVCWRFPLHAQLSTLPENLELRATPVLPGQRTKQAAIGAGHACAVLESGSVHCWGSNHWGELGDGTTIDRAEPVTVTTIHDAISTAVDRFTTCALHASGAVSC